MALRSLILCYLLFPISLSLAANYFNPNATGIKLQNGFERVYIQARRSPMSLGIPPLKARSLLAIMHFASASAFFVIQPATNPLLFSILH
jgi:hypothetical protein